MIPVFDTVDELWLHAANYVIANGQNTGSRDGESRETLGYSARLLDPRSNFMFNPVRKMSPSYAAVETMWYLSGTDDTTLLQAYAPQYKRFTEDGVHAFGAYGHRWAHDTKFRETMQRGTNAIHRETHIVPWPSGKWLGPRSQLDALMLLLKLKPETRQATMVNWNGGDLVHAILGDKKDLPCTLTLSWIVRDNKLNLIANMRSNDLWLGVPNDIFAFTMIQQIVANNLGLELGWYQHQAVSMHYYLRNEEKVRAAAATGPFNIEQLLTRCNGSRLNDFVDDMLTLERNNRTLETAGAEVYGIQDDTIPGLLVLMAASRWARNREKYLKRFESKVLAKYIEEFHGVDN